VAAGLGAVLGAGCLAPGLAGPVWRTEPPAPPAAALPDAGAGVVLERVYQDASYPFGLVLTEGWTARPGASDGALRVVLEHVPTGATLEVWVFHAASPAPRPRAGCAWDFRDIGSYGALPAPEARDVATCTPEEPDTPLVLSWSMVRDALAYHFELLVPPGHLLPARRAARGLLDGVRFY